VITEEETTIVVPASRMALALADGCIDLRVPIALSGTEAEISHV
jgi:hypothetical protein